MTRRHILSAAISSAFTPAQAAPGQATTLGIALSSSLFPAANRNDARVALSVWTATLGRKRGFNVNPVVNIFDDPAPIRQQIAAHSIGIVALDILQYFRMSTLEGLEPAFVATRGTPDSPPRYVLVTRTSSGPQTLGALRGKSLRVTANTAANVGLAWLDSQLAAAGLPAPSLFFHAIDSTPKPSAAVLPVFFGKADAAIIDEPNFRTICEMNPQLGHHLSPIATSQALPEFILCFVAAGLEFPAVVRDAVRDVHLDPDGKQILLALRTRRFLPATRASLEPYRPIFRRLEPSPQ